jgi:hypothetical protein
VTTSSPDLISITSPVCSLSINIVVMSVPLCESVGVPVDLRRRVQDIGKNHRRLEEFPSPAVSGVTSTVHRPA